MNKKKKIKAHGKQDNNRRYLCTCHEGELSLGDGNSIRPGDGAKLKRLKQFS